MMRVKGKIQLSRYIEYDKAMHSGSENTARVTKMSCTSFRDLTNIKSMAVCGGYLKIVITYDDFMAAYELKWFFFSRVFIGGVSQDCVAKNLRPEALRLRSIISVQKLGKGARVRDPTSLASELARRNALEATIGNYGSAFVITVCLKETTLMACGLR
ncbi:uncharacterized protein LY79DRAFT_697916 [Colletotrichum navitas]|uniref:Uncharacterized protein n=1 Tax=Colletotrichum navitas TaxID=681940 RepID=A0AAD8PN93_9PEZI|nr:uncharacterized protein LY79DRAFT_697916 [Colletotrichum navitas]KAK1573247.1 hypothetical protein LY79DRAFT_697916 [Colletotrichum navitas]